MGSTLRNDSVVIWDVSIDEVVELPGVDVRNVQYSHNAIQWSPDGSKLASMSSDGRIIIRETESYEVIAEYDGYRSPVPDDADSLHSTSNGRFSGIRLSGLRYLYNPCAHSEQILITIAPE